MSNTLDISNSSVENPTRLKARNTSRMAEISRPHFDAAYEKGLMGVSCRVLDNRRIEIVANGRQVIDYTRCGYLNLDAYPKVLAAAIASMNEIPSTHFSVARTRLSAEPLVRLEETLATLLDVHGVVVFPTVAATNMRLHRVPHHAAMALESLPKMRP
ncbi:hypothetical protein [Azorhizophilus paspali]|uniref:Uncharacterized protein n=1 Tax=Azorhizophilus paspali TaxID=69963 RepID=A0ABV6SN40_AZOPA